MTAWPLTNALPEGSLAAQEVTYDAAVSVAGLRKQRGPRTDAEVVEIIRLGVGDEVADAVAENFIIFYRAFKSMSTQR